MSKYPQTGCDESTSIMLNFPSGPGGASYAHGIATTSLRVATDPAGQSGAAAPAIRIQGTKGEITVVPPAFRPTDYRLAMKGEGDGKGSIRDVHVEMPGGGRGFFYEADEAARCVRDGKLESEGLSWEESIVIMEVMDEVRRQGGLKYSEKLETTDYPVDL